MFEKSKKKLPIKKAIYWILFSTVFISGTCTGSYYYYWHLRSMSERDSKYNIIAIVQRGPDKDVLKTEYLAESLGLSVDQPTNLYMLSLDEAKKRLLKSPLIRSVVIKRVKPGTLYIDYRVRKPVAFLADYSNTAIDQEGYLIPFAPFFTPKNLPEIVLGTLDACKWGDVLKGEQIKWALNVIKEQPGTRRIDLSQYSASSIGQREIILVLESQLAPVTRILRLSSENMSEQLGYYRQLDDHLAAHPMESSSLIIDLRIPKLAFLKQ
jgi:cell division septal protein FtsQ